jgi:hypothetical protein
MVATEIQGFHLWQQWMTLYLIIHRRWNGAKQLNWRKAS